MSYTFYFRYIFVFLSLEVLALYSHAEIPETGIRGLHQLVKPEYAHLSPLEGLILLRTGALHGIRFQGHYGPRKEAYGCHPQLTEQQQLSDCPQDSITAFVQWMFPSPAGGQLIPSSRAEDLVTHLTFPTIGALLREITLGKPTPEALALTLFKTQYPQDYGNLYREWQNQKARPSEPSGRKGKDISPNQVAFGKVQGELKALKARKTMDDQTKIALLTQESARLKDLLDQEKTAAKVLKGPQTSQGGDETLFQREILEKNDAYKKCLEFTYRVSQAVQAQRGDLEEEYPLHIVESTFLAYAWKKAAQRDDFLELAQGLGPEIAASDHLPVAKPYTLEDYKAWKSQFENGKPTDSAMKTVVTGPFEDLVFLSLARDTYDQPYPRILETQRSHFPSLKTEEKLTLNEIETRKYSDCGETALRNFLNVPLYNSATGDFDWKWLQQTFPQADPALISFYQRQTGDNLETLRDAWSDIVSNRTAAAAPIHYSKQRPAGACDITPSMNNLLTVLADLLGDEELNKIAASTDAATEKSARMLDRLCDLFSKDNRPLSWKTREGDQQILSDKGTTLILLIHDKPSFTWEFTNIHFELKPIADKKEKDWRLDACEVFRSLVEGDLPHFSSLLPFYSSSKTASTLKGSYLSGLIYRLASTSPLDAIEAVLSQAKTISPLKLDLILRWIKSYDLSDVTMAARVYNALLHHPDSGSLSPELGSIVQSLRTRVKEDPSAYFGAVENNLLALIKMLDKDYPELWRDAKSEALFTTTHKGSLDVATYLIATHPELLEEPLVYDKYTRSTPLHHAVANGQLDIVKLLIDRAPQLLQEPLVCDNNRSTPLHDAAGVGQLDIVKLLIDRAPQLLQEPLVYDNNRNTPLHIAIKGGGQWDVVNFLIDRAPQLLQEPLVYGQNRDTPLHVAVMDGHIDVVRLLATANPSLCTLADANGKKPIDVTKNPEIIEILEACEASQKK